MTNVEVRVRSSYSALSPTCQKAADYLLAHTRELYSIPIAELARQSGVSSAAWVRLCKEIGYTGLKDMRQQLYLQYSAEPQVEVDPTVHFSDLREGKSAQEILQNVTAASLQALQRTSKLMDPAAYQTASDWLLQSKSIKLFGMGASGLVASDLCDKLLRIGKNAIFNFNSHVQLSYSATLTKDDTAVFISNIGKTQEILQALEAVQASGCHTIGITHYSKSPLSAGCKLLLYTSSKEVYVRSGAMSSRLAQLMVVDALFTVLHANGATSFSEVMSNFPASIPAMLGAYVGLTPADRRHLVEALAILFKASTAKRKPTPAPASAPSSATSKATAEIPAETAAGADSAAPARADTDADAGTTASPSAEDATEIAD